MAKLKVVHKWVGLGWVQSFLLILGRVGLGHFTCGSGWVGSRKLNPRPTLHTTNQCIQVNPLMGAGNYSVTSNYTTLVHWPLMGGLSHGIAKKGMVGNVAA